ncbi:MAG TPA: rRNA maturation RNase YbeY [Candidatus Paceibacterota bacterium]|nr:rRNA maturation RNase YbeY [Candidatus Paceibacterota bacterium]
MLDLAFHNRSGIEDKQFSEKFFQRIISCAIKEVGKGKETFELAISLVAPEEIKNLNRKYRGNNSVTDVLSFPELGDIIICPERVREDAERRGISLEQRMAWVTIHGFLHILGYDHERSLKDEKEMFELERKILESCGF